VLSLFTPPTTTITFDDYLRVESIMELWYTNGKLEATGYASENTYEWDITQPNKVYSYGDKLKTKC